MVRSWDGADRRACRCRRRPCAAGVSRLRVEIANTTPWPGGVARTRCAGPSARPTRCCARAAARSSRSPTRRRALREAAGALPQRGHLAGAGRRAGERHTVLSSPIILEDHPRIAPESPGDLFDGGEIDQLLVLNILALTDEEKAEMRDADPRAREILERTEALTHEELMRLHGASATSRRCGAMSRWTAGRSSSGRAPRTRDGRRRRAAARGSRVRLRPRRGRRRLRPRAGRPGRRSSRRIEQDIEGERAARGRRSRTTRAATSASARQPGHRFFFSRRRGRAARDDRPRRRRPRASWSPGSATSSSATTASASSWRAGSRARDAAARASRSSTSASAAWTSPTRCRTTTTPSCCSTRCRAASAPGTLYVIEPELDDGRAWRSTPTAWTR